MCDIDVIGTLVVNTPNAFKTQTLRVKTPDYEYRIIRLENSALIEIGSSIWYLTDFEYNHKVFECIGSYKKSVWCFIEALDAEMNNPIIQQIEESNLNEIISCAIKAKESINRVIKSDQIKSIQFELEHITYYISWKNSINSTAICLFKDKESYENQLTVWDAELGKGLDFF